LTSDFRLPSAVSLFRLVLHEPEIAPNTGSIMRLCANTGCTLHLVEPFPFSLDDARLRRAGLDYRERAVFRVHRTWEDFLGEERPDRVIAFTGHATTSYADVSYRDGDTLVFGKESVGLPEAILADQRVSRVVRIPMAPEGRSLNLAVTVAVAVYEGWRQLGFRGATEPPR
jgi:tRNA (cytidine/uridine-2'-O-)-methyltransferase